MKDARMTILERVNIEIERTDLQESIALLEKQIKRLSGDIEDAQSEYDNLSGSGMKGFFLGLTGKKETRLQEMQNNIRKLRSELVSAEFEVNSAKARIEEIAKEVENTQEPFQEHMKLYEKENSVEAVKELRMILELPTVCKEIEKIFPEIKPLVTKAADIYDRITKVDEWFYGVYNRWNSLRKQRNEVIKTLIEKVQNDLA